MSDARGALRAVAWCGALMLVLSVVLRLFFPRTMGPLPAGLRTPVLALEIARSSQELETMFGPVGSSERAHWVGAVDRGNLVDFAFIVVYGAFLIACLRAFGSARPSLARLGVGLVLLACVADGVENACLLAITASLGADYASALSALVVATWAKWLALAGCLAALCPMLLGRGRWGTVAGSIAAVALPLAIGAAALRGVIAEVMLLAISLSFVAIWIEALRSLRSERARGGARGDS